MLVALAAGATAQVPPRYLDPERVSAAVAARLDLLQVCYDAAPAGAADTVAHTVVASDGGVLAVQVAPPGTGDPLRDACLVRSLALLRFPEHDEEPLDVDVPLVARGGRVLAHPGVTIAERDPGVLFLFVPPDLHPEARASVLAALGPAARAPSDAR